MPRPAVPTSLLGSRFDVVPVPIDPDRDWSQPTLPWDSPLTDPQPLATTSPGLATRDPGSARDTIGLRVVPEHGDGQVRYVVAIGPTLLRRLRVYATLHETQMRHVAREAVSSLLDRLDAGQLVPSLERRWTIPSAQRTRLAVTWPAPLPDRLRAAAARTGLPAHVLVAAALVPVVAPTRKRRTKPC